MKTLTIYRDSWRRGANNEEQLGDTNLFNDHNMQCCLGQMACEVGLPIEKLSDVGEPGDIDDMEEHEYIALGEIGLLRQEDDRYRWKQTQLANAAISINDNESIAEAEREVQLISLFAKADIAIIFVDGKAPWFTKEAA